MTFRDCCRVTFPDCCEMAFPDCCKMAFRCKMAFPDCCKNVAFSDCCIPDCCKNVAFPTFPARCKVNALTPIARGPLFGICDCICRIQNSAASGSSDSGILSSLSICKASSEHPWRRFIFSSPTTGRFSR